MWERIKSKTGKEFDELRDRPHLSENLVYLWSLYIEIKTYCEKISFVDLDAYQRVTQNELTPWESSMILELEKLRNSDG